MADEPDVLTEGDVMKMLQEVWNSYPPWPNRYVMTQEQFEQLKHVVDTVEGMGEDP